MVGALNEGLGGRLHVHSGRTGTTLYTFDALSQWAWLGKAASAGGDMNRDGYADIIAGEAHARKGTTYLGAVRVFSGRDGSALTTIWGSGGDFGASVSGVGDVNLDGYPDMVVGAPLLAQGTVFVHSGKDWKLLHRLDATRPSEYQGSSTAGTGDINGDRHADILIGGNGYVAVRSGKDGSILAEVFTELPGGELGGGLSGGGDVNRDGLPDWLTLKGDRLGLPAMARVFSGRSLLLSSDIHETSVARPVVQKLFIDTGSANGGKSYRIAGTLSGPDPGFFLGPLHVRLNPDPYLIFTVLFPNTAPLSRSSGILDPRGIATAEVAISRSYASALVGMTVFHALAVVGSTVERVSEPISLSFIP